MKTLHARNRLTLPNPHRGRVSTRLPSVPRPGPTLVQAFVFAGRKLLGAALMVLALLLISTLLLLPVGLPLALLAVALIAAPDVP